MYLVWANIRWIPSVQEYISTGALTIIPEVFALLVVFSSAQVRTLLSVGARMRISRGTFIYISVVIFAVVIPVRADIDALPAGGTGNTCCRSIRSTKIRAGDCKLQLRTGLLELE